MKTKSAASVARRYLMHNRLSVNDGINILALVKGSERYVFLYDVCGVNYELAIIGQEGIS